MNCDAWLIERYEELALASGKMLDLARTGQWGGLPQEDQKRADILAELQGGACHGVTVLDETSQKLAELIGLILKTDAETRSLAESWREELQGMLGSMSTERKLLDAYGN